MRPSLHSESRSAFGIALGLSGAVLFVALTVRAVAFMDPEALIIGWTSLVRSRAQHLPVERAKSAEFSLRERSEG
ncbi:hypothetical protein GCM10027415_15900 [Humibacter ginsengisoli]